MLANFGAKLRLLYFPVVLLGTLLALLVGVSYWLLTVRLAFFDPSSSQLLAGIFGVSALGMLPLLYARLQLLWRGTDDRWITLYYIVPMGVVGFASLFVLDYLQARTGRLAALTSIQELPQHPTDTRYYTLQQCYPSQHFAGVHPTIGVSGKHDEYLDFDLYVACPLLTTPTDTNSVPGWLALHYDHRISNRLAEKEKRKEFQAFLQRSQQTFNQQSLKRFRYLTRVSGREYGREYQQAVQESPLRAVTTAPAIILQPESTLFAARDATPSRHLAWALTLGWGAYMLMLLFPGLSPTQVELWQRGTREPGVWQKTALFLRENPRFRATPALVLLNVLVYLLMVSSLGELSFRTSDLLTWGGSYGPLAWSGEYWRLLTPMFLHGGLLHILYNMISLTSVGYMLEPMLGTGRLVLAYILTGIAGVLLSIVWAPATVSVGASGAIFGLIGVMLGLLRRATPAARGMLLIVPVVFGLPGLLYGFFSPTTDNAGHIGGLLGGVLLGLWWQVLPEQDA